MPGELICRYVPGRWPRSPRCTRSRTHPGMQWHCGLPCRPVGRDSALSQVFSQRDYRPQELLSCGHQLGGRECSTTASVAHQRCTGGGQSLSQETRRSHRTIPLRPAALFGPQARWWLSLRTLHPRRRQFGGSELSRGCGGQAPIQVSDRRGDRRAAHDNSEAASVTKRKDHGLNVSPDCQKTRELRRPLAVVPYLPVSKSFAFSLCLRKIPVHGRTLLCARQRFFPPPPD